MHCTKGNTLLLREDKFLGLGRLSRDRFCRRRDRSFKFLLQLLEISELSLQGFCFAEGLVAFGDGLLGLGLEFLKRRDLASGFITLLLSGVKISGGGLKFGGEFVLGGDDCLVLVVEVGKFGGKGRFLL